MFSLIFSVAVKLSALVSRAVASRTTFSFVGSGLAEMEFYAKSNEEIEERPRVLGGSCSEPSYGLLNGLLN